MQVSCEALQEDMLYCNGDSLRGPTVSELGR